MLNIRKIILLLSICCFTIISFADTLQDIMQRKKIYIGTAGDYKPLTWYDTKTHQYQGLDIDRAKNLAKYLRVQPVFVKTSWPTLSQDLQEKKFDMAIGGISITPDREMKFIFSKPLLFDKKVALIRCDDRTKYNNITDINQPKIRVIENRGGSNEQFARQKLPQAQLIIETNNIVVFSKLINKTADVMITDGIEADYQRKLYPNLCVFQFDEIVSPQIPKAIMIRTEDVTLQQQINHWLNQFSETSIPAKN